MTMKGQVSQLWYTMTSQLSHDNDDINMIEGRPIEELLMKNGSTFPTQPVLPLRRAS